MSTAPIPMVDLPDPNVRRRKAVWRQLRNELTRAAGDALTDAAVATPLVGSVGSDESLSRACSLDLGLEIRHVDSFTPGAGGRWPAIPCHLMMVVVDAGLAPQQRVDLLRRAYSALRPSGALIVAATVVGYRRAQQEGTSTPSISTLVEEIQSATGMGVHLEELRSIRWRDEPVVRGVVLTASSLATSREW